MKLKLGAKKIEDVDAFVVMIANMPYLGPNMQIDPGVSFRDKPLDVFLFSDMGKLNLISYAIRSLSGNADDRSVKHYKARELEIETEPQMALRVDSHPFEAQRISVRVLPKAITVMAGLTGGQGPDKSEIAELKVIKQ